MKRYTWSTQIPYGWYSDEGDAPSYQATLIELEPLERVEPWWWGLAQIVVVLLSFCGGMAIMYWAHS